MVDFASILTVAVSLALLALVIGWVVWAIVGRDDVPGQPPILLFRLARRLGIDMEAFSRANFGMAMAESVRTCLSCREKNICQRALDGSRAVPFGTFCPNADRLRLALRTMAA